MYARDVGFIEAVRLGFQNYFNFSGRAQRAEYWWFVLFTTLASIALSILDAITFGLAEGNIGILSGLFSLAVIIPTLSLGWRRLHDIGKSGFWLLLPYAALLWLIVGSLTIGVQGNGGGAALVAGTGFIAFLGSCIYLLVLLVRDSGPHPNRWGESPKYSHLTDNYQAV